MKKILVSACACFALTSTLVATEYKIEPVVTKSFTKSSSKVDDYATGGIRVSRELVDALSLQVGYEFADDVDYKNSTLTTNIHRYIVNAVYDFKQDTLTPYVFAGGGYEKVSRSLNSFNSQTIWNAGVGLRYKLTEVVDIFTEGRYTYKVETEDKDKTIGIGLSFKFGGTKPAPVVVKEEPKEEPKPLVKEEPKDTDGDGVIDALDKCPNTPKGLKVDKDGCALNFNFQVNFDFDKSNIKPEYKEKVLEFAKIMKENPLLNATIEGHTDSIGNDAYNQKLSQRRAEAVREALISEGIEAKRLNAVGYGETKPIADNNTAEGRYENRRVEANTDIK
ncbi:OmpA family protein [Arcobacter sp. FWKO B]|uniref:OmpA family protein n=1 Tax=Arcobacter sp. FWKO B TaxID=2593672 RepID=UPI0018A395C9|nr:OmpA family protein [Arcobacter sp. FWKO B]QOG11187.1 OmpA family protein [Arcobacter sp. FWKO B]